jgi:large subunit ribosomal protein L6
MSRIGRKPVPIPKGVKVGCEGSRLTAEGPKGKLAQVFHRDIRLEVDSQAQMVRVHRAGDDREQRALHGLSRALVANMMVGVTQGYQKELEVVGTGYRVQSQGKKLSMQLGFSHPVEIAVPEGVVVEAPDATHLVVKGTDKAQVGQFAARIRAVCPPEPYKGKGIRYRDERVRRKAGKTFTAGSTA